MSAKKLREAALKLESLIYSSRNKAAYPALEIGIATLREKAAQMESAEQGFEEVWKYSASQIQDRKELARFYFTQGRIGLHAMQANLDAAKIQCNNIALLHREAVETCQELEIERDAANERVKELEAEKALHESLYGIRAVRYRIGKVSFQGDEDEVKEAMRLCLGCATAERERELLRGEVRRIEALVIKFYMDYLKRTGIYIPDKTPDEVAIAVVDTDRSPEVRALVDAAGSSGATG